MNDDGLPWGFMDGEQWVELPKAPRVSAGLGPPPFTVEIWSGPREIVHSPEQRMAAALSIRPTPQWVFQPQRHGQLRKRSRMRRPKHLGLWEQLEKRRGQS